MVVERFARCSWCSCLFNCLVYHAVPDCGVTLHQDECRFAFALTTLFHMFRFELLSLCYRSIYAQNVWRFCAYVKVKDAHYIFHASVCVTGESDKHGDCHKEELHLLLMWLWFIKWVSLTVTTWWCKGMFLGAVKGIWHTSHSALAQTRWFVEPDWRAARALFSLGRNAGPGFVCPTDHQKTALH